MEIGKYIRNNRRNKNFTQQQVEDKTGVAREYQSRYENGGLKNPGVDLLYKLVTDGTGVPLSEFFAGVEAGE